MVIDEGICVYGQVRRIGLTDDVERAGRIEMRPALILGRGRLDWGGAIAINPAQIVLRAQQATAVYGISEGHT